MYPPSDDYPERIERVMRAVVREGIDAGAAALAPIAYKRREVPPRPSLNRAVLGRVFQRDRFHCRYCTGKTIPTPLMELLSNLYPDEFPWHPNWKGGQTHPAVLSRSPVVDHVEPGSSGGSWTDEDNMVTACWPCNARKADLTLEQIGWEVSAVPDESWDGLTGLYGDLWEAAGRPKPNYHQDWMRHLGVGDAPVGSP